jgi:hypothetical protein
MKFKSSEVPTLDDVEVGMHDPNGGREKKTTAVDVFYPSSGRGRLVGPTHVG